MLQINFESDENSDRRRKTCVCQRNLAKHRIESRNIEDAAETVIRVMGICGVPVYRANKAKQVLVKALKHFDEIRYRIDRLPKKRLCREDLIYRLSSQCQYTRKETQLTYAILRRVFRAFYYGTKECGEHINATTQLRHSQECLLVHAAKRIAEILALIEGMFDETRNIFENRIKCVFKHFYDRIKQRANGYELLQCTCPNCLKRKKREMPRECEKQTTNDKRSRNYKYGASSSSEELTQHQVQFCLKVCAEKEAEMKKLADLEEFMEAEDKEEQDYNTVKKCDCPKLVCNDNLISNFTFFTGESSQGPFLCKWLPISKEETIWDDICTEPEKYVICQEAIRSSNDISLPCHDEYVFDEDLFCYEDEHEKAFIDNFNESTISATISQFSCHIFHCKSDTYFEEVIEEDTSSELTADLNETHTRVSKNKKIRKTSFTTEKHETGNKTTLNEREKKILRKSLSIDKDKSDMYTNNNEGISNFNEGKTKEDVKINKDDELEKKVEKSKIQNNIPNTGNSQTPKEDVFKKNIKQHTNKTNELENKVNESKIQNDLPNTENSQTPKVLQSKVNLTNKLNKEKNKLVNKYVNEKNNNSNIIKNNEIEVETENKRESITNDEVSNLHKNQIEKTHKPQTGKADEANDVPIDKTVKTLNPQNMKNQKELVSKTKGELTDKPQKPIGQENLTKTETSNKTDISKTKIDVSIRKPNEIGEKKTLLKQSNDFKIDKTGNNKQKQPKENYLKDDFVKRVDTKRVNTKRDSFSRVNMKNDNTKQVNNIGQNNLRRVNTKRQQPSSLPQDKTTHGKIVNKLQKKTIGKVGFKTSLTTRKLRKQHLISIPLKPFKRRPLLVSKVDKETDGRTTKSLFPKTVLTSRDRKRKCCKCPKRKPRKCPKCVEP